MSTPAERAVPDERPDAGEHAGQAAGPPNEPVAGVPAPPSEPVAGLPAPPSEPVGSEPVPLNVPAPPSEPVPLNVPAPPSEPVPPAAAESASVLPGAHRGGFQRLPTAPLPITSESAPPDPDGEQPAPVMQWTIPEPAPPTRGLAVWALAFAILALVASFFVGWGFPLGIVAIVAAILALRRPVESRAVAVWAIVLGAVSIVYSAGWLVFAGMTAGFIG